MRGRVVRLSAARRLVGDLMHFASGVPSIPVQRRMSLEAVVTARSNASERPPWTAIIAKAFARVAAETPELRRAYCKFPRPHLYEYPRTVASLVVERDHEGEKALFTLSVKAPETKPLAEVAHAIREAQTAPVESVKQFRRQLKFAKCPGPLRRVLWWLALNLGRIRANYFGTFLVTAYSALGAESLHPRSPLTITLTYGPIADDGSVNVRLIYDHRVMDGATVARALARMEAELNGAICDELRAMAIPPLTSAAVA